jgi:hypothetical protein
MDAPSCGSLRADIFPGQLHPILGYSDYILMTVCSCFGHRRDANCVRTTAPPLRGFPPRIVTLSCHASGRVRDNIRRTGADSLTRMQTLPVIQ